MKMQQEVQQLNEQIKLAELEVNRQKQIGGNAAPLKRLQQAPQNWQPCRASDLDFKNNWEVLALRKVIRRLLQ